MAEAAVAFETRSWRLLGALAGLWLLVVVEAAAHAAEPPAPRCVFTTLADGTAFITCRAKAPK